MSTDLKSNINNCIVILQKQFNFDPGLGVEQIDEHPERRYAYDLFVELKRMAKKVGIEEIAFDPSGTGLIERNVQRPEDMVYFAYDSTDKRIWKIGFSNCPIKRAKHLDIGRHTVLSVYKEIPGGFDLESKIKFYLNKSNIRGELFALTTEFVDELISKLKSDDRQFLNLPAKRVISLSQIKEIRLGI